MAGKKVVVAGGAPADDRVSFDFRGVSFEVSRTAYLSARVQKGLALASDPSPASQRAAFDAIDAICCGRSDEYMGRIPEEGGDVGPYGCSSEAFSAFMAAAGEAISKN